MTNSVFVHNEDCGVEIKMIEGVEPYVEDKTSVVTDSVIASYAGKCASCNALVIECYGAHVIAKPYWY